MYSNAKYGQNLGTYQQNGCVAQGVGPGYAYVDPARPPSQQYTYITSPVKNVNGSSQVIYPPAYAVPYGQNVGYAHPIHATAGGQPVQVMSTSYVQPTGYTY